jgi:hypothetical protein
MHAGVQHGARVGLWRVGMVVRVRVIMRVRVVMIVAVRMAVGRMRGSAACAGAPGTV